MKYKVSLTGTASPIEYKIEPGESIELPLDWVDPSGHALNISGATVRMQVNNGAGVKIYEQVALPDPTNLTIPGAITSGWKLGAYEVALWMTDSLGHVSEGSFRLWLKGIQNNVSTALPGTDGNAHLTGTLIVDQDATVVGNVGVGGTLTATRVIADVSLSRVTAPSTTAARTEADRAADTAGNPMNFGAIGDGVADDTAAVQACVTYCLSFTPPKAMVVTKRHYLTASVNIDRLVNTIADKSYFRVLGQGDQAGFCATADINLFSSTIAAVAPDVKCGRIHFENISFSTDQAGRLTNVLDEVFMRVTFISCTFRYIRCYNYLACYTQEFRWQNCLITEWTGVFASSLGSYNAIFTGCHVWDGSSLSNGLFASLGPLYSANVSMAYNVIEALGGPIAAISGGYGCTFVGNQIEYIRGPAFTFSILPTSNIAFIGNFCVYHSGPFVTFSAVDTGFVTSIGNNLTVTQYTPVGGARVMYGGMEFVAGGLVSSGDNMTRADGLSGDVCTLSDATSIVHMNGIERHGISAEAWSDADAHLTKMVTGQIGIGRQPVAAFRVIVQGDDQSATKYAAAFVDSVGNGIALFRNDRQITFPVLLNYPDNAAAKAGGLVAGDLFRNGNVVMVAT